MGAKVIASAIAAFVLFVIAFLFLVLEVVYAYGAGAYALLAAIAFTGVTFELKSRRTEKRKVTGGFALAAGLLSFGAFVASAFTAKQPYNQGLGLEIKPAFALIAFVGCTILSYLNLTTGEASDELLPYEGKSSPQDVPVSGNKCRKCCSCCKSGLWIFFTIVVFFASYHTIKQAKEQVDFFPGEENLVVVDGHTMRVKCLGPEDADQTVFFAHGLGGSVLDWAGIQQNISSEFRACGYDRAGYGRSQELGNGERISVNLATETKEILDFLEIDEAIFVGHSFAGFNLRVLESRHPEMFQGLVLIDAVNPNNTASCDPNVEYPSPLYVFGLKFVEFGLLRLISAFGLLGLIAPIDTLPEDVQQEYVAQLNRAEYFRTRVDEFTYWGKNCDFVKNLDGDEKDLDFPVYHVYPSKGIHRNDITFAEELVYLSTVEGTNIEITDEDANHVNVMFDVKYNYLVSEAVRKIASDIANSTTPEE